MKVTPATTSSVIIAKTTNKKDVKGAFKWWAAKTDNERCDQLLATANYLKENQQYRYRQAAIYARLYGNQTLFSFIGQNMSKLDSTQGLPADRPTFNLCSSATDTVVSKLSQSRPAPVFLTDNSDYKERNMAKKLNNFILGEFYQTKTYDKATIMLRDACVEGTGCLKIYETLDGKVGLERKLLTELLTDPNESIYGDPRQLYEVKLIDRDVLMEMCPKFKANIKRAEQAYVDNSAEAAKTVSDLVMVVEAWRKPSCEGAGDGRHTIACSGGIIYDEKWDKMKFPFVFLHYSQRLLGFWAQGLVEQLMGTQMEINSLLFTISRAIKLVGVPRVFVEEGSKVSGSSFNSDIGSIIKFRGTKPIYEVAECVPQELYAQLQRLIDYGYKQCGVSALDAGAQKPAGLNSGEAIRSYDDISTDRIASLARSYDNVFIDLAYGMIDLAKDIAERDGAYSTVYPGKNGTKQVDLPNASLLKDTYIIQCYNMSSLPKDPAGRMQKVTEMITSGMIDIQEGRRLLDFPDLEQNEKLANASQERIFWMLDKIIEEGEYTPPDSFLNLLKANEIVVQYYNLYAPAKLEPEKMEMLRMFFTQVGALQTAAQPPAMPGQMPGAPAGGNQVPQPAIGAPPPQQGINSAAMAQ